MHYEKLQQSLLALKIDEGAHKPWKTGSHKSGKRQGRRSPQDSRRNTGLPNLNFSIVRFIYGLPE